MMGTTAQESFFYIVRCGHLVRCGHIVRYGHLVRCRHIVRYGHLVRCGRLVRDTYIGPSSWLGGVSCPYRAGVMRTSENALQANFREFIFHDVGE
jgi:hypothetical protein